MSRLPTSVTEGQIHQAPNYYQVAAHSSIMTTEVTT